MKTIATINFKGGVGKTTVTWALAQVVSQEAKRSSLMFDLDAQMSLTQAIALNEDGNPFKDFSEWYDRAQKKKKTIFHALDLFTQPVPFEFGINYDFIYQITPRHHFVPSDEQLYWTELEVFDREKVKFFIQRLLEKTQHSKNVPAYDVVLFDCPPSFSLLSYSILSCCDLVLIPINPDFFAAKGLNLLLNSLKMRIEPFPIPKIGVFMNRAKRPGGSSVKRFSNETQRYSVAVIVKAAFKMIGRNPRRFGGRSLRSGLTTSAAKGGFEQHLAQCVLFLFLKTELAVRAEIEVPAVTRIQSVCEFTLVFYRSNTHAKVPFRWILVDEFHLKSWVFRGIDGDRDGLVLMAALNNSCADKLCVFWHDLNLNAEVSLAWHTSARELVVDSSLSEPPHPLAAERMKPPQQLGGLLARFAFLLL